MYEYLCNTELSKLNMIALGGQADIYELENDKIIRVLRSKSDEDYLKSEMRIMNALYEKGKSVPRIYEYLRIEDRPSLIMERIMGTTMLDAIRKNPLHMLKMAEQLAKLHLEATQSAESLDLTSIHDRASHLIPTTDMLTTDDKDFILGLLESLPKENDICHGDFHPGNIMISNGKYYIIDWFGATSGSKLCDIAHTYLLLRNTPKLPGISKLLYQLMKMSSRIMSNKYLSTCYKGYPFDYSELSRWLVIRAAERVVYGMPMEKEAHVNFIRKCKRAKESGIQADGWWKFI
ncbi:MAG TPA: phosphotransferase [Lachnospiraceae bacterium]|nr:phosphotransferase [Lachnospiraceae bacterium]